MASLKLSIKAVVCDYALDVAEWIGKQTKGSLELFANEREDSRMLQVAASL